MKLKKDTYKNIVCLLMLVVLIVPTLIINLHVFFHHKDHHHDTTTFCSHKLEICECNDFTFTFFDLALTKVFYKIFNLTSISIDNNSIENIYFILFLGSKKGRSPPCLF